MKKKTNTTQSYSAPQGRLNAMAAIEKKIKLGNKG
jgi:hypothetical protein